FDPDTGIIPLGDPVTHVVTAISTARLQVAGKRVAVQRSLQLIELSRPARVAWAVNSIGGDQRTDSVMLSLFAPPRPAGGGGVRVRFTLQPEAGGIPAGTPIHISQSGGRGRTTTFAGGESITACVPSGGSRRLEASYSSAVMNGKLPRLDDNVFAGIQPEYTGSCRL
ncbi:MAG: hypothetical protein WAP35_03290, partial [Solirubrobacterales bacterium]